MHGVKRVIVFCVLTVLLPTTLIITPLYLRHSLFADIIYSLTESDIIEIRDGISSIFCQRHTLFMNTSFNAFQLTHMPAISTNRKHIRLKKSMRLPDDTLEYWGFYLLKGATVELRVCSRYDGARILVVKGEKNLKTCGLLDHNKNKVGANLDSEHNQVRVTFETAAEIVDSGQMYSSTTEANSMAFLDPEERLNVAAEVQSGDELPKTQKKIRHARHRHHLAKRDLILDRKINHGGTAINWTDHPSGSVSSFENSLLTCYDGQILLSQSFDPAPLCENVTYLDAVNHMVTTHEIVSNGYYYYIFYSDNDLVENNIHAVFDIHKPTFQYSSKSGMNDDKSCVNSTRCTFPIHFGSDETVIVEVPTRDGIEHEDDDITYLISSCEPRMMIYCIFPIMVLVLILSCAFI